MSKKEHGKQKKRIAEENLEAGMELILQNKLFSKLYVNLKVRQGNRTKNEWAAIVERDGNIILNADYELPPGEWAYVIAHGMLHLAFGHFDAEKMPGYELENIDGSITKKVQCNMYLWNMACDMYVAKFLSDIKFGKAICANPADILPIGQKDELQIYEYLEENHFEAKMQEYGTASENGMDMSGLETPIVYEKNRSNPYAKRFAEALIHAVSIAVSDAGGHSDSKWNDRFTKSGKAAQWFINHYPLLGGVASGFRIIEDWKYCEREEIQIAAVDAYVGEIYVNPNANLSENELKFVLAHEFLHAGLQHQERCQGRNAYLWNIACDYVINGWLMEMQIGQMPEGVLYDEDLKYLSAEEIYDRIITDFRKYMKLHTLRGYGKGDIIDGDQASVFGKNRSHGVSLDEFFKEALSQGLAYHQTSGRGYISAGLIEEIRALSMPPIPWDVELAEWFEEYFPALEKRRSYARPSRRQGATPNIPRPGYVMKEYGMDARTFGVVVDTSGSMSTKQIGMALGSIASYAAAKEVPCARVVFCDAAAYDAGYLSPEEIAGRVEVKGRGGTKLQPGVDLLEAAKDFPENGPILIITDGEIEKEMTIRREHAFLLPKGKRLPFRARGKVFYFS